MKLNKMSIRNFRAIGDTVLDTAGSKFVVLRGKNAQGKTSVSEAISLALTDTTFGLDKRGAGFARKIKRGESKATLEATLQGANRTIKRTVTLNVSAVGRTQHSEDIADPEWHSAKFEKLLSDRKTALDIAINTRSFQSMIYSGDEKAQKNLLASLVLPARYDFPKETIAEVESLIGQGTISFEAEPFSVIEQAYKKLFAERQDVNRRVKEFRIPDALPRPQGVDSESLEAQLSVLRDDRQKQSTERDVAAKQANEEALKRDRINARIATLEAVLKASKEALRGIQENILTNPSAVQEVAERKAKWTQLIGEKQRLEYSQSAAKAEHDRLMNLSNMGGTCPTCDQDIDDDKIVNLAKANIAERTRLKEAYDNATHAITAIGDIDGAIAKLEKHKKAQAELAEAEKRIQESEIALNTAKDEAGKDFGGLFESASHDSAIAETDRNIEKILQQIQPVIAAEERDKDIALKTEQKAKIEAKASKLDKLVRYFDKDGIKAELIAAYIGAFEMKVNEVLSGWNYSCALSIEPFKFEITDYRGVSTHLIDLSGAEELMFYAAFQCAVSRTAGIGFVVIDRVDTLLPELRPALYRNLHKMVSDGTLDQVILLVADTSEQVPSLPDSAFFKIVEGVITKL